MVSQDRISLLAEASQHFFLQTSHIWYLPVTYVMESPPLFLIKDQNDYYQDCDECDWLNPETGKYEFGSKKQNVILKAEVRPFLVFQQPGLLRTFQDLSVRKWYGDVVTGFRLSGVENFEKDTKTKIDVNRLRKDNDYDFVHYIQATKKNGLKKDSYIILCAPLNINLKFFTTYIGHLEEQDTSFIKKKVRRILNLDN